MLIVGHHHKGKRGRAHGNVFRAVGFGQHRNALHHEIGPEHVVGHGYRLGAILHEAGYQQQKKEKHRCK